MNGFTLIEILVVLAIVAVMVVAVGLSVESAGPARRVDMEAQRLRSLLVLACDESARFGQDVGLRAHPQGYRFVRAVGREWQPHQAHALRARQLPEGMRLSLRVADREIDLEAEPDGAADASDSAGDGAAADRLELAFVPNLTCNSDGELTAEPRIEISAGARSAVLSVAEDGELRVTAGA